MNGVLILLALLSVATIVSRQKRAAFMAHIAATPILLALGFLFSPQALGFLTPSTLDALMPALHVAVAWLSFLDGLRLIRPRLDVPFFRRAALSAVLTLIQWAALFGVLWLTIMGVVRLGLFAGQDAVPLHITLASALVVAGVTTATGMVFTVELLANAPANRAYSRLLFLVRHDDSFGVIALCLGIWLWTPPHFPFPELAWSAAFLPAGIGLVLALAYLFLADPAPEATMSNRIAGIGLVTLGVGLAIGAGLPEAAVGFFLGAILAGVRDTPLVKDSVLRISDRPVRLVVMVLVGASLKFTWAPVLVGITLAGARFLLKVALRRAVTWKTRGEVPLAAVVGSSEVALPLILSFALTMGESDFVSPLITTVAVAVSVTDLIALLLWPYRSGPARQPEVEHHESAKEAAEAFT
jgi:hypothetical protein